MGKVQESVLVRLSPDEAAKRWQEFDFRREIGRGRGPAGQVGIGPEERMGEEEYVRFEDAGDGVTRVTLTLDYDEDDEDDELDVSALRADVNDEMARFRAFAEGRRAA
jgi:hypothetical protein